MVAAVIAAWSSAAIALAQHSSSSSREIALKGRAVQAAHLGLCQAMMCRMYNVSCRDPGRKAKAAAICRQNKQAAIEMSVVVAES